VPCSLLNTKPIVKCLLVYQILIKIEIMNVIEARRKNLRHWFQHKTLPTEEKSYLSQLMGGKASFGEKAARRIELTYGMPVGFLDRLNSSEGELLSPKVELSRRDEILLELFHELPESEADALLKALEDKKRHYDELYKELSEKRQNKAS
jgi:hypothetical protein